ncbi:MAG: M20/M25/M40 family metallo-hydrolase [bacterium]|nr:MAG: M20/M25/M40 family metallo-hydrolase [bacterium]
MPKIIKILMGLAIVAVFSLVPCYCNAAESGVSTDAKAIDRIVSAGTEDNRAMLHLDHLVNDIGSRPANTLNFLKACQWACDEFKRFGLENAHLEKCGEIKGYFPDETTSDLYNKLYRSIFGEEFNGEMIPICNVIADIRGAELPDEYVIVGAHLDSAPQGAGATDNGAGVAVTMEAARILASSGARPRRTIRFILFGGEEVGLVGSNGYVEDHPEIIPKISAVYNMDRGANFISGIVTTEPMEKDMREIFATAMRLDPEMPFEVEEVEYLPKSDPNCCASMVQKIVDTSGTRRIVSHEQCGAENASTVKGCAAGSPGIVRKEVTADGDTVVKKIIIAGAPGAGNDLDLENLDLGALGVSLQELEAGSDSTRKVFAMGSSDHAPFLAAGIPAFWWKQDGGVPVPYPAHTKEDTYDKINARYLEHSATVIALGAFGTANLDHMLSREKLTAPDGTDGKDSKAVKSSSCNPACGSKVEKKKLGEN